jgi:hypothetical protein
MTRVDVPTPARAANRGDSCILLLLAAAGSDLLIAGFWLRHPMLTAIVPALVVVVLSVAVIEAVLSRRAERRWRVLAQTALMELGEAANTTWGALALRWSPHLTQAFRSAQAAPLAG